MNFWDAFGKDVKQSEVKNLVSQNAEFEILCDQPTFIDEFLAQNDYVVNYLSTDALLNKMVDYLTEVSDFVTAQYSKKCHFSYFAFLVLSTCNTKVHERLLERSDLMLKLFAVANENPECYVTAQGYLAGMFKNWISNQNSKKDVFLQFLILNFKETVVPMVHNLSASNAEIIKEVLTCSADNLTELSKKLFQYLVYHHLTENFDSHFLDRNPDTFDNLFSVFRQLDTLHVKFDYSNEHIPRLFDSLDFKTDSVRDDLVLFRFVLVKYLSQTKQITRLDSQPRFLALYKTCRNPFKRVQALNTMLETLAVLCKNQNFIEPSFRKTFLMFLFDALTSNKPTDITSAKTYLVIEQSISWALDSPDCYDLTLSFLCKQILGQAELRMNSYSPQSPYVSMHFLHKVILKIEERKVSQKYALINQWRLKFQSLYKKLAFESLNQEQMMEKKNTVKFDINQDIEFFSGNQSSDQQSNSEKFGENEGAKQTKKSPAFSDPFGGFS